jgi:hypothetical protein
MYSYTGSYFAVQNSLKAPYDDYTIEYAPACRQAGSHFDKLSINFCVTMFLESVYINLKYRSNHVI